MIKRLIPFIFATVLGFAGVFMTQQYIAKQLALQQSILQAEREQLRAEYQEFTKAMVEIVIARTDISEGQMVSASHLDMLAIPQSYVQPYATTRATDVIGLVTVAPIAKGEQILRNKLQTTDEVVSGMTLAEITPNGMRAVTIGTDVLTGVGGMVRPGDQVDLHWTFEFPEGPTRPEREVVTLTLLQNVSVLAVGDELAGAPKKTTDEERPRASQVGNYTVTLALSPQDATMLLYARREGVVQLSLRSDTEKEFLAEPPLMSMTKMMNSLLDEQAVLSDLQKRTVQVIRGLEQEIVVVGE